MFYNLTESTVQVDGTSLGYVAFGKGDKNLILIQGLGVRDLKGAGAGLALMYREFAKDYRVYLFDRPYQVQEGLTIADLARSIHSAMQALGIDTADVVGISHGGMIAMELAIQWPQCVDRLVLGVTAARPNDTLTRCVEKWQTAARNKDRVTLNKDSFYMMYTDRYLARYKLFIPLLARLVKPRSFERFAILTGSILTVDCYDRLNEIKCPVLVIGAQQDRIVTPEASVEIAQKLGCRMYIYPQYGHAVYEEANDFNKRIYNFLHSTHNG